MTQAESVTVTKGKEATGNNFEFRAFAPIPGVRGSGKIVVGDEPVKIDLKTAEARKVGLEQQITDLASRKYLNIVSWDRPAEAPKTRATKP